jgi:hypothetical protein
LRAENRARGRSDNQGQELGDALLHVTAFAWCIAFFGFALLFGPILAGARPMSQTDHKRQILQEPREIANFPAMKLGINILGTLQFRLVIRMSR